jgi:hypothetical protein
MTFRLLAASLLGLSGVRTANAEKEPQWQLADVAVACPEYTVYSSYAQFVFSCRRYLRLTDLVLLPAAPSAQAREHFHTSDLARNVEHFSRTRSRESSQI